MYLPFKKQGLKALKCLMEDFYRYCLQTKQLHMQSTPAWLLLQLWSWLLLPLGKSGKFGWDVRKFWWSSSWGSVSLSHRKCGFFPAERICWCSLALSRSPALRFGSNTPPCSPALQKSLAPKTKRLIMEIMQIRRELQIASSSAASVSTARAVSSQGILHGGTAWEQGGAARAKGFTLSKSPRPALVEGLSFKVLLHPSNSMDLWVRIRAVGCCSPSWATLGSVPWMLIGILEIKILEIKSKVLARPIDQRHFAISNKIGAIIYSSATFQV